MNIAVSIIIVATNEIALLRTCIRSITHLSTTIPFELIVIDNASNDTTHIYLKRLRVSFPLRILTNTSRVGFAANCNKGIHSASGKYFFLLNPDTRLYPDTMDVLFHFMEHHVSVGICAPQLINVDGSLQFSCRRFPTWKSFLFRRTLLRDFFSNTPINDYHLMKDANHTLTQKVDWVLGGCMFIRKKMIEKIGPFDNTFFLYVDDIDMCYRAWKAKWEVWYVPITRALHHHMAKSDKALCNKYSLYHLQSVAHFVIKHGIFLHRN